ncbi:MAG: hypothetical protein N2115_06190 [bacterium]|nr:hypothetical protein [bacterium]
MSNDFIAHWKKLDRNARRELVKQFITSKKHVRTSAQKQVSKRTQDNRYDIKKSVVPVHLKMRRRIKPVLAFGFASSDPSGGGGDVSGSPGASDQPSDKEPQRKPALNFKKPRNSAEEKRVDSRRNIQKQKLIELIKALRAKEESERLRRRGEVELRRRIREEARKQAIIKAEAERAARLEAEKIRRQELMRIKIEKAHEKKEKQEARRKEAEEHRRQRQLEREQIRKARQEAIEQLKVRRQLQKQRLVEFIKRAREKSELERLRREKIRIERARKKRLPAEPVKEPTKPVPEPVDLRPIKREKLHAFIKELKDRHLRQLAEEKIKKEALKKQKEIIALAKKQERQVKAIQTAEFKARQKQLALQKRELLKAEILLAAKKKQKQIESEKARKEFIKQLNEFSARINNSVSNLNKSYGMLLSSISGSISAYVKKAKATKIRPAVSFTQVPGITPAPVKEVKIPVKVERKKKYKEPIKLGPFLRKNAFRLLFFLLLLVWLGEILFYTMRWQPPRERFEEMFGASEQTSTSGKAATTIASEEIKIEEYKVPSINIEGKRDPFSGGLLTMELVKKPKQAEIMFAYRPEIITITKKPSIVTQEVYKPVREKPEKITPILKPEKPEPTLPAVSEATVSKILPPAPVVKPEISPLIVPQIECTLVYRGSLIMEGIEYIFIEGKQRTYRVTVGDVVEGFRILKKEKGILTLSKEGVIVEIPAE